MKQAIQVCDLMWVSIAKENELDQVMLVFNSLLEESEYKKFVPEDVVDVITQLIKNETVLCLRDEQGKIIGLLIFTIHNNPHILFKKSFAQELVWCVLKPYRKHSKLLVSHYELVAKVMGCTSTMLAAVDKFDVVERLYKTMGYNKFEVTFEKELT